MFSAPFEHFSYQEHKDQVSKRIAGLRTTFRRSDFFETRGGEPRVFMNTTNNLDKVSRHAGLDRDDVSRVLEEEGVGAFVKSFDELLDTLGQKAETLI